MRQMASLSIYLETEFEKSMGKSQQRKVTYKDILWFILVAVIVAILTTLVQRWWLGHSIPAVTGAVTGVIMAPLAIRLMKRS